MKSSIVIPCYHERDTIAGINNIGVARHNRVNQHGIVFGSRFMGGRLHRVVCFWPMVGNRFLTLLSHMFTNLNLTDIETCYKAFRGPVIESIRIEENRFGFEPEITAKVAALNCRIYEVGISYSGRTYQEGKKIGWKDGFRRNTRSSNMISGDGFRRNRSFSGLCSQ